MKQSRGEEKAQAETAPSLAELKVELKLLFPRGQPASGMQKLLTDCKFDLDLKGLSNSKLYLIPIRQSLWVLDDPALPLGH